MLKQEAGTGRRGVGATLWKAFGRRRRSSRLLLLFLLLPAWACAESCLTGSEVEATTRSALEATAQRYFEMVAKGDTAALRQNSIPALTADFAGVETAVRDFQQNFVGAKAAPRPPFLLKQDSAAVVAHAEFFCGVFGARGQTGESAVFLIPNLAPGAYAIVVLDVAGDHGAYTLSVVLQEQAGPWKLGGLYAQLAQIGGHDGKWFIERARDFKLKGHLLDAWLYDLQAQALVTPVPFMTTLLSETLYDEAQAVRPADLPAKDRLLEVIALPKVDDAAASGSPGHQATVPDKPKSYKVFGLYPQAVGDELAVVAAFQYPDVSATAQVFQDNTAVIRAIVAKYPELRDAFSSVVARATEPSGKDYGTLLKMSDVK